MDNAALVKRRDSRAAMGRPPAVPAKAKAAIAALLEQPETDLAAAAQKAGLPTERLKKYLKAPHVRKYFIDERRAVLDAILAGNPEALRKVRDTSGNAMARVQAVRALESIGDRMDEAAGGRAGQQAPGVVIVIEAAEGRTVRTIRPPSAIPAGHVIDAESIETDGVER
jgi:hypothetical protein